MKYKFVLCVIFLGLQVIAQKSDSTDLTEMVISANRINENASDVPKQILVINAKTISGLNQQTTADLLLQSGNVFIQKSQQGGGSPILRGMEANRILLAVDGIRLNNAIYRGGHLQNVLRIDQNGLEKVEILFGAGSLMYGSDAMGGVINLVTKQPQFNNYFGNVMARYASVNKENTINAQVMQGFKKFAFYININNSSFQNLVQGKNRSNAIGNLGLRNFYQGRYNDTDRVALNQNPNEQIGSAYQQSDANVKLLFAGKKAKTHLFNFQFSNTSNVPRYDRLSEFKNDTPVFSQWFYGPELRTLAAYTLTNNKVNNWFNNYKTTIAYQYIEESRNSRSFNANQLNARNEYVHLLTLNTDFFKQIHKNELRYGLDFAYNFVNSFAFATNILNNSTSKISTRYPDGGSVYTTAGIFISNAYEKSEKLIFNTGVRLNLIYLNSVFNDKSFYSFLPDKVIQTNFAVNANVGVVYKLNNKTRFFANIANAFRAPNVDDMNKLFDSKPGLQIVIPNNNLLPEQSVTAEIGSNLNFKKLQVDFTAYYTYLYKAIILAKTKVNNQDSVVYDGKLTPVFTNQNMQNAFIMGFGLNATYKLTNNLQTKASYNYTLGQISNNNPLDHIPPAFGRASVLYKIKQFNTECYVMYAAAKTLKTYNINGEDNLQYATANGLPGWSTINFRVGFANKSNFIQLNAAVENVLDTNYRLFASGISAAGRNFILSVKLTL